MHEARTPVERQRLRAAALAALRVRPPGIVRVASLDDDVVVTEEPEARLTGRTLHPAAFADAARALAMLHRDGVAHGAIDADLLRVDPAGRVVLPLPAWTGHPVTIDDDVAALCRLIGVRARSARDVATALEAHRPRLLARSRRPRRRVALLATAAGTIAVVAVALAPRSESDSGAPARTTVPASTDRVLVAGGHRYLVGQPGDEVIAGRWGCGPRRPAVIRPRTGEVFVFAGFAAHEATTAVTRLDGVTGAGRAAGPDGCDVLVVDVSGAGGRRPRSPVAVPAP